jgi:hypothetical protein
MKEKKGTWKGSTSDKNRRGKKKKNLKGLRLIANGKYE